jgi:hypothetical protein
MIQSYTEDRRDHILNDLVGHHELLSNEIAMKYLHEIKTKVMEESKENLIKSIKEAESKTRKLYFFRIENETPIGKIVEIGYFIK